MTVSRRIIFLIVALLFGTGLFFIGSNVGRLREYFREQKLLAEIKEMERPYREDVYGGQTPEETYALLIQALKAGDIELAAKYFLPKRQADWLKELQAQKEQNKLGEFISTLPTWEELKAKSDIISGRGKFSYTRYSPKQVINFQGKNFELPEGNYSNSVIFIKNTFTNKWKIEHL